VHFTLDGEVDQRVGVHVGFQAVVFQQNARGEGSEDYGGGFGEGDVGGGTEAVVDEREEEGEEDYVDWGCGGLSGECSACGRDGEVGVDLHAVRQPVQVIFQSIGHVVPAKL
jgi:hypothetical protein